ncbi:MAG: hypothetical protein GY859_16815, partial [Desulfobacterales bacterium]|nr:hypothetical protein [Desulfobacterales bacterium]
GGTAFSLAACDSVTGARVPVGASDLETARNLADAVNNTAEKDLDVTASVDGAKITLRAAGASEAITSREIVDAAGGGDHFRVSDVINHRAGLADQYHSLMEQVDAAAGAPGFRGVNLLKSDRVVMTVKFEGGSLDVTGFDASAAGLGAHVSATRYADIEGMQWAVDETIDTDIAALEDALEKLGIESSRLSSNTSVITTRRAFSTSMTDLLLAGADGLTSAEAEEEGANMLMLQTWQDLSITSLALSAEAAQAALRLF